MENWDSEANFQKFFKLSKYKLVDNLLEELQCKYEPVNYDSFGRYKQKCVYLKKNWPGGGPCPNAFKYRDYLFAGVKTGTWYCLDVF